MYIRKGQNLTLPGIIHRRPRFNAGEPQYVACVYDLKGLSGDIEYNRNAGGEILSYYLTRHAIRKGEDKQPGGHLARATYSAYNGGPGAVGRYRSAKTIPALKKVDEAFWDKFQAVSSGRELDGNSSEAAFWADDCSCFSHRARRPSLASRKPLVPSWCRSAGGRTPPYSVDGTFRDRQRRTSSPAWDSFMLCSQSEHSPGKTGHGGRD
jgi:hypothetical protein